MTDLPYTGAKIEARASPGRYVAEVPGELEIEDLDDEVRVYRSRWIEVEGEGGALLSRTWTRRSLKRFGLQKGKA